MDIFKEKGGYPAENNNAEAAQKERLKKIWRDAMEEKVEFTAEKERSELTGEQWPAEKIAASTAKLERALKEVRGQGRKYAEQISRSAMEEIAANPEKFLICYPELVKQALRNELFRINNTLYVMNLKLKELSGVGKNKNHPRFLEYQEKLAAWQQAQKDAAAEKDKIMTKFRKVLNNFLAEEIYTEQKEKMRGQFFLE